MRTTGALTAALDAAGIGWRADVPLGPLSTYRCGGPAAVFVEPEGPEDLAAVARVVASSPRDGVGAGDGAAVPVLVVGRGSNLLVADDGFDGLVVHLGEGLARVEVDASTVVAGGAASLPVVARRSVAEGLTGFEWAVGVPGSIGGAVRMNAGGHGSDMAASLVGVRVVDLRTGETRRMLLDELHLSYRSSSLADHEVVASAELSLAPGDREAGERELARIVRWRREHQPGGANAGSVFTNPVGDSAGRLVEESGAKGLRIGTARVSEKHANFIQSDDDGTASDVFELMVEVARRVRRHSGVELHPETRLVGFEDFDGAVGR